MYIAVDIGGSKTLLTLLTDSGRIKKRLKMKTYQDQNEWIKNLNKFLPRILPLRKSQINAAIFSYPGVIKAGHPDVAPNLKAWHGKQIEAMIKSLFISKNLTCKILYKNDADLGALFECQKYSGTSLYLTFGTGIGGSLIKNGKLDKRAEGFEPGHILKSYRGKRLEWEKIASSKAIRAANDDLDVTKISDQKALEDVACRFSVGLADLIKKYRPDHVVLSGPIIEVFPGFKDTLIKLLGASLPKSVEIPKIHAAKHPQESVIYGAYLYGRAKN
jgi:predicted NBD/HSP70 family sugar kinase